MDNATKAMEHIQTLRDFYGGESFRGITLDVEIDAIEQELKAKDEEINRLSAYLTESLNGTRHSV